MNYIFYEVSIILRKEGGAKTWKLYRRYLIVNFYYSPKSSETLSRQAAVLAHSVMLAFIIQGIRVPGK